MMKGGKGMKGAAGVKGGFGKATGKAFAFATPAISPKSAGKGMKASFAAPIAEKVQGDPDEPRMLSVRGLPFEAQWQELKDHMSQAGTVEFSSILADEWGSSKGVGFVRYSTIEEAQQAIGFLDGSEVGGRQIKVGPWTGPKPSTQKGGMSQKGGFGKGGGDMWSMMMAMMTGKGPMKGGFGKGGGKGKFGKDISKANVHGEPDLQVHVSGLPDGTEWQELKDHMKQAGSVEFCNARGGTGQVRFGTAEEAQNAIAMMNGSDFGGHQIEVYAAQ